MEGEVKIWNKQKIKLYITTQPALKKTLKGILQTEDKVRHSHESMGIMKSQKMNR
jgi:hypothetical protein